MTQAVAAGAVAERSGLKKWAIAIAVSLGALLEVIDTSIVNVALPDMQTSLSCTLSEVSWVFTSYVVANVIILPLAAWLGERFGKRRFFVFSLASFTLVSVLCGLAVNLPMLIVARVLQGLCGGGLLSKAQAMLFQNFTTKEDQAMAQGFFGTIVIAGPAIGPTLGGWLVANAGWRWIFLVNLPVGIGAVLLCLAVLPKDAPKVSSTAASVDWLAVLLLAVGLGGLQIFLEEGQSHDWFDSNFIRACAACAVVGLTLFVIRELTVERPIVNLRVLKHRPLWAGSILSVVVGIGLYGTLFAVPIFAQTTLHYTAQQTGMLLVPGALVSIAFMPITARLIARFEARKLLVVGALTLMVSLFSLSHLSPQSGGDDLFWPLIIRAAGIALIFLPLNMATLGPIPRQDIPAASGFFSLTRQIGGSVGVAGLTTLLVERQTFHRAVLIEKIQSGSQDVVAHIQASMSYFVEQGSDLLEAQARALSILNGRVVSQAMVMSFGDSFWLTLLMFVFSLPLVVLLGKVGGAKPKT